MTLRLWKRTDMVTETIKAASPVWLRLVDNFTGLAPTGPIEVTVERQDGAPWVPVDLPPLLKSNGDLAFVNLGRVRKSEAGAQFDIRVTAVAPRMVAETASGEASVTATITTWTDDTPPPKPIPQEIRFYPGPDYPFGPGVPLLPGQVIDANGDPAARAQVTATETVLGNAVVEEVRSTDDGTFRLPLRWSSGSTQIDARRQGRVAPPLIINVPADLGSVHIITLP
jgi:hypothetical protein